MRRAPGGDKQNLVERKMVKGEPGNRHVSAVDWIENAAEDSYERLFGHRASPLMKVAESAPVNSKSVMVNIIESAVLGRSRKSGNKIFRCIHKGA
jgi:hypothetical protein